MVRKAIVVCLVFAIGTCVQAADRFKVGESVEVFFLNQWLPAEVLAVDNQGRVRAQFQFANKQKVDVFRPEAVRHQYESGAIWRGRMWSDSSGKFKVKAALLEVRSDEVVIRTDEMKMLTIGIEKLSDNDKKFLQKLREMAGGGIPLAFSPKVVEFETDVISNAPRNSATVRHVWERKAETSGFRLEADPLRASLKLTQAGVAIPNAIFGDNISTIIPLGGNDHWMMVSLENAFANMEGVPLRIHWVSLAKAKVQSSHALPAKEIVLDYHAGSKQLLTFALQGGQFFDDGAPTLSIWETQPAVKEAKGIIAWRARLRKHTPFAHAKIWARFASADIVLQRDEDHHIIAWDTKAKRAIWTTTQESFFAPEPVLSHGGKYLFVPEDRQLRILDPITGAELGYVTTPASCSGVALRADGKTLGILANKRLLIVDLTGQSELVDLDASTVGNPFAAQIEWVRDDLLAIPTNRFSFTLFSIQHALPLWHYQLDGSVVSAQGLSGRTQTILNGYLAYAASTQGGNFQFVVGAVEIPEKAVVNMIDKLERKNFMQMGPGTRVRVIVEATESLDKILSAIRAQVAANQWIEDPNAAYTVKARLYRGETQTVQYEEFGSGRTMSLTATPHISSVEILKGEQSIWTNQSSSGIPPVIHLREGQDAQRQVDAWQVPDIGFFERFDIPDSVLDSNKKHGLGKTDVTIRGLETRN